MIPSHLALTNTPPSPTFPVNYPLNPLLYPLSPAFDTPLVTTRIWAFQKHLYIPI